MTRQTKRTPQYISHYTIIEPLGRGGMGQVYKAKDTRLDRIVALKLLTNQFTNDEHIQIRFRREAIAASKLDHPNICTIYEIDETDAGETFIAMSYCEGETLKERIARGKLDIPEAINLWYQIALGLQSAHRSGIVHRDIKPANLIISPDSVVKIVDFGVAKLLGSTAITKENSTPGTVAYMSPEQATGDTVDERSDIWSLGVVLYEMLTDRLPFAGDYDQAVIYSILNINPTPLNQLRPEVSDHLALIVHRCLEKEPHKRFASVDQLLEALKSISPSLGLSRFPLPAPKRNKPFSKKVVSQVKFFSMMVALFALVSYLIFLNINNKGDNFRLLSVAVTGFENLTGDHSLDFLQKAIPNLLITSLEQSDKLQLTTWEMMQTLARKIDIDDPYLVDADVGFKSAQMAKVDAIVRGSFVQTGNVFAIDAKVIDPGSGNLLQSVSTRGNGVESILRLQIDELSQKIANGFGFSQQVLPGTSGSIAEVTTQSIDAYNYYLRGKEDYEKFYSGDARKFMEKAVTLDSTFAIAYLYLAWIYGELGDEQAKARSYEKALKYSKSAGEKERLYIEVSYSYFMERNRNRTIEILTKMAQRFPAEKRVHWDLANLLRGGGFYEQAILEFKKVLELDPDNGLAINALAFTYTLVGDYQNAEKCLKCYATISPGDANPFDSLGELYLLQGNFEQAEAKFREAIAVKEDYIHAYHCLSYLSALQENYKEAIDFIEQFIHYAPTAGLQAEGYLWKGFYHYWTGHISYAERDLARASLLADSVKNILIAGTCEWVHGWICFDRRDLNRSRDHFKAWYQLVHDYHPPFEPFYRIGLLFSEAMIDIQSNAMSSAIHRCEEMDSLLAQVLPFNRNWLSKTQFQVLRCEVGLIQNQIETAFEISQTIDYTGMPYMHTKALILYNTPHRRNILARIYEKQGEIDKAIGAYKKIISRCGSDKFRGFIQPIFHFKLAQLHEQIGEKSQANAHYQKFINICSEAELFDTEIKISREKLHLNMNRIQ